MLKINEIIRNEFYISELNKPMVSEFYYKIYRPIFNKITIGAVSSLREYIISIELTGEI